MPANTTNQKVFTISDWVIVAGGVIAVIVAAVTYYWNTNSIVAFLTSALAVTLLAALVGRCVEQLGDSLVPALRVFYNLPSETCRNYSYPFSH